MDKLSYSVSRVYCYDCVIALRKFAKTLDGVESIEMPAEDRIEILFDSSVMEKDKLRKIIAEGVEKLGFNIQEI